MPDPSAEVPFAVWQVPQAGFRIEYAPGVLEEIRSSVVDAFFSVPRGGAEIGGVLYGALDGERVRILDFRPLECEHAFGPSFVLSEGDHARLAELLEGAAGDPLPAGLRAVGWYHSHTRSEIFLSGEDLEIHRRYFPEPWQMALVLKPHTYRPMRAGFFVRGRDGALSGEASYEEFVLQPRAERPAREPEAAQGAAAAPAGALEPDPAPAGAWPVPGFLKVEPRRRRAAWPFVLWALLAGGAGGAYALRDSWLPKLHRAIAAPPLAVDLTVLDQNGQLVVRWDRTSPAVRQSSGATLDLTDGPARAALVLSPLQLQTGTFTYARQTGRVDVRLTVRVNGSAAPVEAFTVFLGQPPEGQPHAPAPGLRPGDQELAGKVRSLESRNAELDRTVRDLRNVVRIQQDRLAAQDHRSGRSNP